MTDGTLSLEAACFDGRFSCRYCVHFLQRGQLAARIPEGQFFRVSSGVARAKTAKLALGRNSQSTIGKTLICKKIRYKVR